MRGRGYQLNKVPLPQNLMKKPILAFGRSHLFGSCQALSYFFWVGDWAPSEKEGPRLGFIIYVGGGFNHVKFSPLPREMIQLDLRICCKWVGSTTSHTINFRFALFLGFGGYPECSMDIKKTCWSHADVAG